MILAMLGQEKPKKERADCMACGHWFVWGPDDGRLSPEYAEVEDAPDSLLFGSLPTEEEPMAGTCPRCGEDAVVYGLPGGHRIRFHDGYAVLKLAELDVLPRGD